MFQVNVYHSCYISIGNKITKISAKSTVRQDSENNVLISGITIDKLTDRGWRQLADIDMYNVTTVLSSSYDPLQALLCYIPPFYIVYCSQTNRLEIYNKQDHSKLLLLK